MLVLVAVVSRFLMFCPFHPESWFPAAPLASFQERSDLLATFQGSSDILHIANVTIISHHLLARLQNVKSFARRKYSTTRTSPFYKCLNYLLLTVDHHCCGCRGQSPWRTNSFMWRKFSFNAKIFTFSGQLYSVHCTNSLFYVENSAKTFVFGEKLQTSCMLLTTF